MGRKGLYINILKKKIVARVSTRASVLCVEMGSDGERETFAFGSVY